MSSIGATQLVAVRLGATALTAIRIGSLLVYAASPLRDDFNRADQLVLTSPWVNETPSAPYHAGVEGNAMRLVLPDGLTSQARVDSWFRYATQSTQDDGTLEIRVAYNGAQDYTTQVFSRYVNDGTRSSGVGIHLSQSKASIVRRVAGVDTIVAAGGMFGGGAKLVLSQAGNVHTLTRNGNQIAVWDDASASAAKGPLNRSIGIHVQAAKEASGPRRFSPSLDYIQAT